MNWRDQAACLDVDTELFFPLGTTSPAVAQVKRAKEVCAGCPVRVTCLDWAVELNIDHGVWGGLSEVERRSLKRRRARSSRPVTSAAIAVVDTRMTA